MPSTMAWERVQKTPGREGMIYQLHGVTPDSLAGEIPADLVNASATIWEEVTD